MTTTTKPRSRYHGRKFSPVTTYQTVCPTCGSPVHTVQVLPRTLTPATDQVALYNPHPTMRVQVHADGTPSCQPAVRVSTR